MTEAANVFRRIWQNKWLKELVLFVAAGVAVQLALGLNELLGMVGTSKSWGDLLTSAQGWALTISFTLVQTAVKQGIAWALAHLGGTAL